MKYISSKQESYKLWRMGTVICTVYILIRSAYPKTQMLFFKCADCSILAIAVWWNLKETATYLPA